MTTTTSALRFTETLLRTIRTERHLGTRVLISTQEPTISGKLLDLCTLTLVHRFQSPEWLAFLKAHIAAAGEEPTRELMARIVGLDSGEGLLFATNGMVAVDEGDMTENGGGETKTALEKLGLRYLKVKIRKRVTADGGKSVLAVKAGGD